MNIQAALGALILVALICLGESQITFSRSWVRGKLPGEERVIRMANRRGDSDNGLENLAFQRNTKAQLDIRLEPLMNTQPRFPIGSKASLFNMKKKFVMDFLQKMRYPTATRFKGDQQISLSSEGSELSNY